MDQVTGGWRKLQNEELRVLYSSLVIIRIIKSRRMRWTEHVVRMGEKRKEYRLLVSNPKRKISQGRPRYTWVDNIKMDLVDMDGVVWTGLVSLRIGTS
jgi:hypothetical protein